MSKFITVLYLLGIVAVSAAPLVLDKTVNDGKVLTYYPYEYKYNYNYEAKTLRALYLTAKLGSDYTDGFATVADGTHKHLPFKVEAHEKLQTLLALSDCKEWYVVVYDVYNVNTKANYYKVYAYENGYRAYTELYGLAHYLYLKVPKEGYKGLVEAGLPVHYFLFLWESYY